MNDVNNNYAFRTCFEQDDLIGRLSDNTENAIDTDSRVLDAYIGQCTGEAQEGNNPIPIPHTFLYRRIKI